MVSCMNWDSLFTKKKKQKGLLFLRINIKECQLLAYTLRETRRLLLVKERETMEDMSVVTF